MCPVPRPLIQVRHMHGAVVLCSATSYVVLQGALYGRCPSPSGVHKAHRLTWRIPLLRAQNHRQYIPAVTTRADEHPTWQHACRAVNFTYMDTLSPFFCCRESSVPLWRGNTRRPCRCPTPNHHNAWRPAVRPPAPLLSATPSTLPLPMHFVALCFPRRLSRRPPRCWPRRCVPGGGAPS